MISVLIPVYNFEIIQLVESLHFQLEAIDIGYEIIIVDDGSTDSFKTVNRGVGNLSNVNYEEGTINRGRSGIRNYLGKKANGDFLLFMDCDSKVNDPNFINNYLQELNPNAVLYGGRNYQPHPPSDLNFMLHWKFGINREQIPAAIRMKNRYESFMTNNFMIPRPVFLQTPFDETIKKYGHEDTLFGYELKQQQISIIHLENPLEHIGLESNETFLSKSEKAIENLLQLYKDGKPIQTKLLRTWQTINHWKLNRITFFALNLLSTPFKSHLLTSSTPNLRVFDTYKLWYLLKCAYEEDVK